MEKEEMIANVEKGLMPCGCERKACNCNLTNVEYTMKYSAAMSAMLKYNKKELLQNKGKLLKATKNQFKKAAELIKKK